MGQTMTEQLVSEHAPAIIERVGGSAVIAESIARIFYRTAVNVGIPILTCDMNRINESDGLHVNLLNGVLVDRPTDDELAINLFPPVMMQPLRDGGLTTHVQTHSTLELD